MSEEKEMLIILLVIILTIFYLGSRSGADAATELPGLYGIENVQAQPPAPTTGYGFKEESNWTGWNKFWFGSSIALFGVGDTASTIYQLKGEDSQCSEGNPVFGSDPNSGVLILSKVAMFGLMWWVGEYLNYESDEDQQLARNIMYGSSAILGGVVTTHNMSLDCY